MKKSIRHVAMMMVITLGTVVTITPARASVMDKRIIASAQKSYVFTHYLKNDDIKIESYAGVVVLKGTVAGESHKSMAEETLEGLPGVKNVKNYLKIKGKSAAIKSDEWITARVENILLLHRNLKGVKIDVFVKHGNVILTGKAYNMAQKDLASEYTKDVVGVKSVNNNMTVKNHKSFSEKVDDVMESIDDASITALVKTTLLYHRSTSAINTKVKTNQGIVTLDGKAKNVAERDLATKFVQDVHGVKSVVNNMVLL